MSQPVPGNYFIINADVFPSLGLAMTFNGQDQNVTVTGLVSDVNDQSFLNQVWTVNAYDSNTQSVSPLNDESLQIGMGSNVLVTIPAGSYVWAIDGADGVYTVQDGGKTVYWDIATPTSGEDVIFDAYSGSLTQDWIFVPAPSATA